jgi:hypothetical protein
MRRTAQCVGAFLCALMLTGCFAWTEDSQGHLSSVGLPGVPLWQSQPGAATAQPVTPADLGLTPDEAAKLGGPTLMIPPTPPATVWRYRYYQTGQNHCQEDLEKFLVDREQKGVGGPAPYCTDNPTAPPTKGQAFIF